MHSTPGIPISEAAARLGLHRTRINKLIRAGLLPAAKVGARYLVDPGALEQRLAAEVPVGRPLASRNAWALLGLASGDPAMAETSADGMSPSARSRVRSRLNRSSILALAARLRSRALVHHLRADPADLECIAGEPSLVLTGLSAAGVYEFDIAAPDTLEAYVPLGELRGLTRRYFLEPSARSNVLLHAVDSTWPFPAEMRVAPPVVAALDLFDSEDARARRAGKDALERLEAA
jgi:excisionase family DNA binding protein